MIKSIMPFGFLSSVILNLLLQPIFICSHNFINYFPLLYQHECWHCLHPIFLSYILFSNIQNSLLVTGTNNQNMQAKHIIKVHTASSSTPILMNSTSVYLAAKSLIIGSICPQGPHHVAVKSITI